VGARRPSEKVALCYNAPLLEREIGVEAQRQVVTFLMTDIVGSTGLWEREPDAMARATSRHDTIAGDRIAEHGGRLVKPRGEGDSLFAVFADPRGAIAAACDLQTSFGSET
jgi:class 3 adenylate cyclase